MKYKKIMMLTIILTFVLVVSTASASEISTDDFVSLDGTTDEVVSAENINPTIESTNDEIGYLSENPDGTFTDLANEIANATGELNLTKNYVYDNNKDSNYENGIEINKEITINGKGFVINGNNDTRIFRIESDNVTLKNIDFVNGSNPYSGGAISWHGNNGILTQCNFNNCTSLEGGAMYATGNVAISSCNFTDCRVIAQYSGGGAIYHTGYGEISDCNFNNCCAGDKDSFGGAICAYGPVNISSCNFTNCRSTDINSYGGAISCNSKANISNCNFDNIKKLPQQGKELNNLIENTPDGGILELNADYKFESGTDNMIQINKTITIEGNNHTIDASHISRIFYVAGNNVTLRNINFANGFSSQKSGAIFWKGNNGIITQCNFNKCTSLQGGAIYAEGNVAISSCNFTDCRANGVYSSGGAIYCNNYSDISSCNFDNCIASGEESCGGAIYCNNYSEISSCNFTECESTDIFSYGGAIYSKENLTITKCNFDNCKALASQWAYAGAIYLISSKNSSISYCNFNNCEASAKYGSAGAIDASNTYIYCCNFNNCQSLGSGSDGADAGALFSKYNNEISSCNFTNCHVSATYSHGGAIYGSSLGNINNCSFVNNSGTYLGSAIYWSGDNSSVINCSFVNNTVFGADYKTVRGGAIYWSGVNGSVVNCSFMNSSFNSSVAVYWQGQNGNLNNCKFLNNTHNNVFYDESDNFEFIKRNISLVGSDYIFDYNHPEIIFLELTALEDLPISDIQLVFNRGNNTKVLTTKAYNNVVSLFNELYELDAGNWSLTVIFEGDDNYYPSQATTTLTVIENVTDNTKITASPTTATYNAGSYYKITVYGTDGKLANGANVVIAVNGKTFKTIPTVNGVTKFKITQIPGKYQLKITSLGKTITKTLTVNHLLTLKKVTVKKSAKKLLLTATLGKVNKKYLKNKKITFKFNGKKYTAKTNAKGVAKVTIKSSVLKKLKVGNKVTYQAIYIKDTVKKTAIIKK